MRSFAFAARKKKYMDKQFWTMRRTRSKTVAQFAIGTSYPLVRNRLTIPKVKRYNHFTAAIVSKNSINLNFYL